MTVNLKNIKLPFIKQKEVTDMSYDGIRKLKIYQDENGKWNFSCETYDSSIRDWRGNRVWEKFEGLKTPFETREELEYYLFKNTLDGNFHGTGGKFGCLGWGNRKVKLSEKELVILQELEDKKYSLMYGETIKRIESRLREKGLKYEDFKQDEEWLKENAKIRQACKEYDEFRYGTYFKRWQEYLEQQKINNRKGNKRTYIVKVDYNGYVDIYIKSHGIRTTSFTNYSDYAKLFTMPIDDLKALFIHDGDTRSEKYKRMEFIDVTDFIKGKGKYRHAEIPAVEVSRHITRVL